MFWLCGRPGKTVCRSRVRVNSNYGHYDIDYIRLLEIRSEQKPFCPHHLLVRPCWNAEDPPTVSYTMPTTSFEFGFSSGHHQIHHHRGLSANPRLASLLASF